MGPSVTLTNNVTLTSNQEGQLSLNNKLSSNAQRVTILSNLKFSSLISLDQLYDDNCMILLNKKNLYVIKDNNLLLKGHRNYTNRLWDIPLINPDPLQSEIVQQPSHAGLYSKLQVPTRQPLQKKITLPPTNTCAHKSAYSRYNNIFQGLDTISDGYNDYKIMNDQQKSDRIQQQQHTLNVIIRKDKTK